MTIITKKQAEGIRHEVQVMCNDCTTEGVEYMMNIAKMTRDHHASNCDVHDEFLVRIYNLQYLFYKKELENRTTQK